MQTGGKNAIVDLTALRTARASLGESDFINLLDQRVDVESRTNLMTAIDQLESASTEDVD